MIVGFPTETPEAFQKTLDLVEEAALTFLHVFRYSDRPGTPASAIPRRFRVSAQEMQQRSEKTRQTGKMLLTNTTKPWIGRKVNVLVETLAGEKAQGKTDHFFPVQFQATTHTKIGQLVPVHITGFDHKNQHLYGHQNGVQPSLPRYPKGACSSPPTNVTDPQKMPTQDTKKPDRSKAR